MMLTVTTVLDYLRQGKNCFQYYGRDSLTIENYCSLNNLKPRAITWIKHIKSYDITSIPIEYDMLIVIGSEEPARLVGYNVICCNNPKEIFFSILTNFFAEKKTTKIESTSIVKTSSIGENVSIGCNCYIGKDVIIADNVIIHNNVVIDCPTHIENGTIIYSGVIIGSDGFGYFNDADGICRKVPHFGGVKIGKNVEIGANTCIDRGTIDDTIIGDNAKIDNLCHIAHNVQIGENVWVIALSMLGGSCKLENKSYIAPCAAIMNQITIGENSLVGMGSVVTKSVEPNKVVAGVPAKVLRDNA